MQSWNGSWGRLFGQLGLTEPSCKVPLSGKIPGESLNLKSRSSCVRYVTWIAKMDGWRRRRLLTARTPAGRGKTSCLRSCKTVEMFYMTLEEKYEVGTKAS